ncbi:hypothetical protein Q1695_016082 [Nippostrongylus brasiliensis]|nr:hypothetical protein Q1695_016082 [Nippostrongylus brasiliensis]
MNSDGFLASDHRRSRDEGGLPERTAAVQGDGRSRRRGRFADVHNRVVGGGIYRIREITVVSWAFQAVSLYGIERVTASSIHVGLFCDKCATTAPSSGPPPPPGDDGLKREEPYDDVAQSQTMLLTSCEMRGE